MRKNGGIVFWIMGLLCLCRPDVQWLCLAFEPD